nr:neuropeptide receptor 15-like isoform X2 [Crassostrea virginica]XP_022303259.1 neuropeptide receptor 15-like isoform X2 [Crassostrea virginica]XP_022303260.1 neuropeptide receptor 15-like isoform X2 [Crassostrea virginica]XP_022303261.1 neuropeptide receptor 15-like isoform X2 [Crassostrea virginica]
MDATSSFGSLNHTDFEPVPYNLTEALYNTTGMENVTGIYSSPGGSVDPPVSLGTIIILTILFFFIGVLGIVGNSLVITVILIDRKMRQSVTNVFIMNLAIADLLIMISFIPDIIQFILNKGWLIGVGMCKFNRYILVTCLYVSVLSLVSVCIERFVAIVFPIKAQILCNRWKNIVVVSLIWFVGLMYALPTAFYNQVVLVNPLQNFSLCLTSFPSMLGQHFYKFSEFALFYFIPVCIQIVLYAIIGQRLYVSTSELHTKFQMRKDTNCKSDRTSDTIKARKGVVKMLVASVIVYTVCYAPPQVLLFYNAISNTRFQETWEFVAIVHVIAYINSAANPILYSIFSQNFRKNFKKCLKCICLKSKDKYRRVMFDSTMESSRMLSGKGSQKTIISRV